MDMMQSELNKVNLQSRIMFTLMAAIMKTVKVQLKKYKHIFSVDMLS